MKSTIKCLIFLFFIAFSGVLQGQVVVLTEGFESGLGGFSTSGNNPWGVNSALVKGGTRSAHDTYGDNQSNVLTLKNGIDLSNYSAVLLEFWHIAKLELGDSAIIQISNNNGQSWTTLDTSYYMGSGFMLWGNTFNDASYTIWDNNNFSTPTNQWWQRELFDLSDFTGVLNNNVKIRFILNSDISLSKYGWLIDDIKVTGLTSGEIDPPVILHTPQLNTGSTKQIKISAKITDASGIDSANLFYRVDAGSWLGPIEMTDLGNDVYSYYIPGQPAGSEIDYYIKAVDGSSIKNFTFHPTNQQSSYHTYEIKNAIFLYPYFENFETSSRADWTHKADLTVGNTGVVPIDDWELGFPAGTLINSPRSGSNAYMTNLSQSYSSNCRSALFSPVFDFSVVSNPVLSFFHKYSADLSDGARVDYTVDEGYTWHVLGSVFDPKSYAWYNSNSIQSASTPLVRPGWTGSSVSVWTESSYNITDLAGPGVFIQFRFAFSAGVFSFDEGWAIDDVTIDGVTGIGDPTIPESVIGILYPNPANDQINIPYQLKTKGLITILIINALGQTVLSKVEKDVLPGKHIETLNVGSLPEGFYAIQLVTGATSSTSRIVISR